MILFWFESLKEEAQQGSTPAHSPQLVLFPLTCSNCFYCWDWNSYTNTRELFMHSPHSCIHLYLLQWRTCAHGTCWIVPQVSCVCVCVCVCALCLCAVAVWCSGRIAPLLLLVCLLLDAGWGNYAIPSSYQGVWLFSWKVVSLPSNWLG